MPAAAGECFCPTHAEDKCIRRREVYNTAMRPFATLLYTFVVKMTTITNTATITFGFVYLAEFPSVTASYAGYLNGETVRFFKVRTTASNH